jgi:hypothetical protein
MRKSQYVFFSILPRIQCRPRSAAQTVTLPFSLFSKQSNSVEGVYNPGPFHSCKSLARLNQAHLWQFGPLSLPASRSQNIFG